MEPKRKELSKGVFLEEVLIDRSMGEFYRVNEIVEREDGILVAKLINGKRGYILPGIPRVWFLKEARRRGDAYKVKRYGRTFYLFPETDDRLWSVERKLHSGYLLLKGGYDEWMFVKPSNNNITRSRYYQTERIEVIEISEDGIIFAGETIIAKLHGDTLEEIVGLDLPGKITNWYLTPEALYVASGHKILKFDRGTLKLKRGRNFNKKIRLLYADSDRVVVKEGNYLVSGWVIWHIGPDLLTREKYGLIQHYEPFMVVEKEGRQYLTDESLQSKSKPYDRIQIKAVDYKYIYAKVWEDRKQFVAKFSKACKELARSKGYDRIHFREELFLENGRLTVWDGPNSRSVRLDKETLEEIV